MYSLPCRQNTVGAKGHWGQRCNSPQWAESSLHNVMQTAPGNTADSTAVPHGHETLREGDKKCSRSQKYMHN